MHKVSDIATKITLAHLKRYNMFHGFPVAPEALNLEGHEFGNQFNNFNAGKILLFLEGFGGIRVSHTDDSFTYADSMPSNWTFMEFRIPVRKSGRTTWVKARSERRQSGNTVTKTATVENNPYTNLHVQPWAETAQVSANGGGSSSDDHVNFQFANQQRASVQIGLDYSSIVQDLTRWDGSLAAQGLTTKLRDMTACAVPNNPNSRTYEPCVFQGGVWSNTN